MNLGNMWSNYPKNKVINVNKKNNNNNVFQNIFASNTQPNYKYNPVAPKQNIIPGFTSNHRGIDSKKYWGEPTWYLFHTIASRIDENFYKNNYQMIWNFIKDTCSTLPCPYCRLHASNYVSKIRLNNVNTKEKLIDVLFTFHNTVNRNTGKTIFKKEELIKYKHANVTKIFNLFQVRFFKSYFITREFNDWNKLKYKNKLLEFIEKTQLHYN